MTVAIYARVSTADQNCERQVIELTEWAGRLGLSVAYVWKETASGAKSERAERAKLMSDARRGYVKTILVHELTRWSRSTVDLIQTLEQLASYGCSVRALNGFDFDMATPHGRMLVGVLGALAQFERDLLRERIASGIQNAKRKGVRIGHARGHLNARTQRALAYMRAHPHMTDTQYMAHTKCSRNTIKKLKMIL